MIDLEWASRASANNKTDSGYTDHGLVSLWLVRLPVYRVRGMPVCSFRFPSKGGIITGKRKGDKMQLSTTSTAWVAIDTSCNVEIRTTGFPLLVELTGQLSRVQAGEPTTVWFTIAVNGVLSLPHVYPYKLPDHPFALQYNVPVYDLPAGVYRIDTFWQITNGVGAYLASPTLLVREADKKPLDCFYHPG